MISSQIDLFTTGFFFLSVCYFNSDENVQEREKIALKMYLTRGVFS